MSHLPLSSSLQKAAWVFFRDLAARHSSASAECCFRGVVNMLVAVGEKKAKGVEGITELTEVEESLNRV